MNSGNPDSSLSGISDNFKNSTNIIGKPSVRATSKTPTSISFRFNKIYVEDYEVTNAAQEHCLQNGRNAMLISAKDVENESVIREMLFQCVE